MTSIFNETIQLAWSLYDFFQIDHDFVSLFTDENRRTIQILTVKNFKFFKTRVSDSTYSSQWRNVINFFRIALNQFRLDIEQFRRSKIYRNFLIKSRVVNSQFNDSNSFVNQIRIFNRQTFAILSDVLIVIRFRKNNDSEIRAFNFSPIITSKTSKAIDFAFDFNFVNTRDIFVEKIIYTQFIDFVMSDQKQSQNQLDSTVQAIINVAVAAANIRFEKHFRRLKKRYNRNDRRRDRDAKKSKNSSLNDQKSSKNRSIIKFSENIDYFDSKLENAENRSLINVDRHLFYRDVFAFETRLKNLIKIFFVDKIRKLILITLRNRIER